MQKNSRMRILCATGPQRRFEGKESQMSVLSIIVAFIAALVVVAGILRDDKGPGNSGAAIGLAVVGIVGLFLSEFIGSLSH